MGRWNLDADNCDDRLENLALLCPNCHSQTENFAGRNVGARRTGAPAGPDGRSRGMV
jgi:hypothetical protein